MNFDDIMISIEACDFATVEKDLWYAENFVPLVNKLYYITEGSARLIVDNQTYMLNQNDLVLIPLRSRQTFYLETDKMTHYYCHFTLPIGKHLDLFDVKEIGIISHNDKAEDLIMHFEELIKDATNISELFHRKKALIALLEMHIHATQPIRDKNIDPNTQALNRMTAYIFKNLNKQHTTSELAGMMNVHPNYFIRLFKKHYGMPPIKYINSLRVNMAIEHLLYGTKTVTEIAELVGFSDVFYFSKLFKKYTGKSPKSFRKKTEKP